MARLGGCLVSLRLRQRFPCALNEQFELALEMFRLNPQTLRDMRWNRASRILSISSATLSKSCCERRFPSSRRESGLSTKTLRQICSRYRQQSRGTGAMLPRLNIRPSRLARRQVKRGREVAKGSTAGGCHGVVARLQARQDRKVEPPRDKTQDRRRVIQRMIDEAFPGERRNDQRRNAASRPPAVRLRRPDMIPEAAVIIVSHDDEHMLPLRALLEMSDYVRDVLVARQSVGIAGMLVQIALRLVERDRR